MSNCKCLQVIGMYERKYISFKTLGFLTLSDTIPNFCSNVVAVCFDAKE